MKKKIPKAVCQETQLDNKDCDAQYYSYQCDNYALSLGLKSVKPG